MPQHVSMTCDESDGLWLPLIEYSLKSGLSLSTIRRKIKSNSLTHRLERGKYLILFQEAESEKTAAPVLKAVPITPREYRHEESSHSIPRAQKVKSERVDDSAVRMVSEAFEHALREKDERIRLLERANKALEDRLNELRLLVRVLEEKYAVRY